MTMLRSTLRYLLLQAEVRCRLLQLSRSTSYWKALHSHNPLPGCFTNRASPRHRGRKEQVLSPPLPLPGLGIVILGNSRALPLLVLQLCLSWRMLR